MRDWIFSPDKEKYWRIIIQINRWKVEHIWGKIYTQNNMKMTKMSEDNLYMDKA